VTSVLVFDVETVPDSGFARAHKLEGRTDGEIREAIGDRFPKRLYHSIICIGALVAADKGSHWSVEALGAPHIGERTEKELITAFVNKIDEIKPQLVTFNGSSFDLPVLRDRGMVNEVSAPGLSARPYFNRYTEDALDLCDVLASFNPQCRASLDELCRMMGMEGKPDDICGGDVESYFRSGRIREIAEYCEGDVVNTYRLWLRYELFRGKIDQPKYEESELRLKAFLDSRNSKAVVCARAMQRIEVPIEGDLLESLSEALWWEEWSNRKTDKGQVGLAEFSVTHVDGLSINIFADEHPVPYFLVSYRSQDASFSILDCARLPGTTGLEQYERRILGWWHKNRALLIDKWNESRPNDCPVGIITVPPASSGRS